jgi:hypothetical protein
MYCRFCSCGLEHEDNYASSICIGEAEKNASLFINSAGGKKTYIDMLQWNPETRRNNTIAIYVPKFCPECGRELTENKEWFKNSLNVGGKFKCQPT